MGFKKATEVDSCSVGGESVSRRVDPNLPPKDKACIHQKKDKSAVCSEKCADQCLPEGFNIWVTWDKTQSTNGPYYLHLPTPIKDIMDRYDIARSNFFKGSDAWVDGDSAPFFVTSAGGIFKFLDLKKLSSVLGVDVTAYDFRKIVSTWALTHTSDEIRHSEAETLQHSMAVAKERYLQAKQVQPQNLTQTYSKEENIYPEGFKKELERDKSHVEKVITEKQDKRAKERFSNLLIKKEVAKQEHLFNKPLGPRQKVLESDHSEFSTLVEEVTKTKMEDLISSLKPLQWRDFVVRLICSTNKEQGEKLRKLWLKLYKGDLMHGVRDDRRKAKERNWPLRSHHSGRRDRNSWIAYALRKAGLAKIKSQQMRNKLEVTS
jgi:hypothetical protein